MGRNGKVEKRTGQHWCESDWISQQLKQNHVVSHQQGIQDSFSQSELRESENQNGQSATQTEWRRSQRSSFDKDGSQKIKLSFRTRKKEDWSDSERGEWLFPLIHWAFTTSSTTSRVSRVVWSQTEEISSKWQLCGGKGLVEVRGQSRPQKGDRKSNNRWLRTKSAEQHLWTHNMTSCGSSIKT